MLFIAALAQEFALSDNLVWLISKYIAEEVKLCYHFTRKVDRFVCFYYFTPEIILQLATGPTTRWFKNYGSNSISLTFDFFILLVPTTEFLTFGSGYVGIVGTVHYGGNHALRGNKRGEIINNQHNMKCLDSRNNHMACTHKRIQHALLRTHNRNRQTLIMTGSHPWKLEPVRCSEGISSHIHICLQLMQWSTPPPEIHLNTVCKHFSDTSENRTRIEG